MITANGRMKHGGGFQTPVAQRYWKVGCRLNMHIANPLNICEDNLERSRTGILRLKIKYNYTEFSIQLKKKEKWRGTKEVKNNGDNKTHTDMTDINLTLAIIINVNGSTTLTKIKRLLECIKNNKK